MPLPAGLGVPKRHLEGLEGLEGLRPRLWCLCLRGVAEKGRMAELTKDRDFILGWTGGDDDCLNVGYHFGSK